MTAWGKADGGDRGIVWFSDGSGQVFKGRLVSYGDDMRSFVAQSSRTCPDRVDVVVILKDGRAFPSGKCEWCGATRLVNAERPQGQPDGSYLLHLEVTA